ncbi:MAG: hypothetical protein K0R39_1649 [Symbiobacteriaceae bacterium]|jgi:hypothetical protein|nr:hypothetical protein [Symbiobacteriaceae bacterium]
MEGIPVPFAHWDDRHKDGPESHSGPSGLTALYFLGTVVCPPTLL